MQASLPGALLANGAEARRVAHAGQKRTCWDCQFDITVNLQSNLHRLANVF